MDNEDYTEDVATSSEKQSESEKRLLELLSEKNEETVQHFLNICEYTDPIAFYCLEKTTFSTSELFQLIRENPKWLHSLNSRGEPFVHKVVESQRTDLLESIVTFDSTILSQKALDNQTVLDYAVHKQNIEMCRFLLSPENHQHFGKKDLSRVCYNISGGWYDCPADILDAIFAYLLKVNNEAGDNLMQIVYNNRFDLFRTVVERNKKLINGSLDENGHTLLHLLVMERSRNLTTWIDYVLREYSEEIDVTTEDQNGETPFEITLRLVRPREMIQLFIDFDTRVITRINPQTGNSALHYAVQGGSPQSVEYLIEKYKLDPLLENNEGENAFFHLVSRVKRANYWSYTNEAMTIGEKRVLKLLLPYTFDNKSVERYGFCRLFLLTYWAIERRHKFLIEFFLDTFYGPMVNSKYPLIERYLKAYNSESFGRARVRFNCMNGKRVCLLLHDAANIKEMSQETSTDVCDILLDTLGQLREEAYESDESLEVFILILDEYRRHLETFFLQRELIYYFPPTALQTREVAQRMHRVWSRNFGSLPINFDNVLRCILDVYTFELKWQKIFDSGIFSVLFSFSSASEAIFLTSLDRWTSLGTNYGVKEKYQLIKQYLPLQSWQKWSSSLEQGDQYDQVASLKHLCRLKTREEIKKAANHDVLTFNAFIESLEIPLYLKKYLRFLDGII